MTSEVERIPSELQLGRPDSYFYHYTSGAGLIGIVESNSIWASDIRYLNDATEFDYAFDFVHDRLWRHERVPLEFRDQVSEARRELFVSKPPVFVFSLTEEGDQLSQWRGYCEYGDGYSIGFPRDSVRVLAEQMNWGFAPCMYARDDHLSALQIPIDAARSSLKQDAPLESTATELVHKVAQVAPLLKHKAFSEEREWRIVIDAASGQGMRELRFRPGRTTIIPYVELPLADETGRCLPMLVNVGPTPHEELALRSVSLLMRDSAPAGVGVTRGMHPLRQI